MEEIDFYELKDWGMPDWIDGKGDFPVGCSNLFIDLSHNTHPMASNILYANFELLDRGFASWFHLHSDTLFLYEKLLAKFKNEILYNHHNAIKHFYLKRPNGTLEEKLGFPCEGLNWHTLAESPNKCAIDFLKQHRHKINWAKLSENSSDAAVEFLLEERRNIVWWNASSNTHEKILALFEEEKENLSVHRVAKNPSDIAVRFILNNPYIYDKILWISFCKNPNDHAINHIISIISENRNDKRIYWASLCENENPRVVDILRNNKDKIVWASFLKNPICFSYNYEMMRTRCLPMKEEIEAIFLRPENIMAIIERERNGEENDFEVISRLND